MMKEREKKDLLERDLKSYAKASTRKTPMSS